MHWCCMAVALKNFVSHFCRVSGQKSYWKLVYKVRFYPGQAKPGLELFEKFVNVSELFKYIHNVPIRKLMQVPNMLEKNFFLLYFLFAVGLLLALQTQFIRAQTFVVVVGPLLLPPNHYFHHDHHHHHHYSFQSNIHVFILLYYFINRAVQECISRSLQWYGTNHGRVCWRTEYKLIFTKLCFSICRIECNGSFVTILSRTNLQVFIS